MVAPFLFLSFISVHTTFLLLKQTSFSIFFVSLQKYFGAKPTNYSSVFVCTDKVIVTTLGR